MSYDDFEPYGDENVYGGNVYGNNSEFIHGGDDMDSSEDYEYDASDSFDVTGGSCCDGGSQYSYDNNRYMGGSSGIYGGALAGCGVAIMIVVVFLMIYNMKKSGMRLGGGQRVVRPARKFDNRPPIRHVDVFDNVLVPASYFDYDAHGLQYINWSGNN